MKTESTKVTSKVQIWAIPKESYEMNEEDPNALPFQYQIMSNRPYKDGSVMVSETEISLWVPEGIDLLEKAIETLKEEIKDTRASAEIRCESLQKQINNLFLLEHKPKGEDNVS